MKVLVLGGTRFIGKHIVEELINKEHIVTVFNRGNHPISNPNVEQLTGDRDSELEELKGRKWDAAIDVSGFIPRTVDKSSKLLANFVKHYTFISSASIYKDFSKVGLNEQDETKQLPINEIEMITKGTAGPIYGPHYGALKANAELKAEKNMPKKTLVVRAGLVVGPYDYSDRLPYWILRIKNGGNIIAPGRPERQVQLIDVRDLAKWVVNKLEDNLVGVYNVTGPSYSMTMEELLNTCKEVCNSDANLVWIDESFLINKKVKPWDELPLWLPDSLNGAASVNNNKAIKDGLSFIPLKETIKDVNEWLINKDFLIKNLKTGLSLEKEKQIIDLWEQNKNYSTNR